MPAFIPLIAACVGAAATVYATESAKAGKKPVAPAFGGANQSKEKIETPDLFGSGKKGGGLLGGQGEGQKPVASLAGALSGSTPQAPQFGSNAPSNMPEDEIRRKYLSNLMSQGG